MFALHAAVRVWTIVYFAPNIIDFQRIAEAGESGDDLLRRAALWRNLNYIRVGIFVAISFGLIPLCATVMNLRVR